MNMIDMYAYIIYYCRSYKSQTIVI